MQNPREYSCDPVVSVAMITYNHRAYIEKAIASILAQEADFNFELVIGDDCSTDGTREVVLESQRQHPNRIRVIVSEKNVGMHENLRRVEQACRGKYIAYCEGDDFWNDLTKLAKQVAFLESRPGHVMVHTHCHRYFVTKKRLLVNSLRVPEGLNDANAYEDILTGRRTPLTLSVLARREALHTVLQNCPECTDRKWPMGDTQRWLELSRLGSIGCIHEPLVTKNVLPESAGQSMDQQKCLRFYLAARELELHYLKKYPIDPQSERRARQRLALVLLQHACAANDPVVARQMYSAYREQGGSSGLRAAWLLWGSHSSMRRCAVSPLIILEKVWRRATRLAMAPLRPS